MDTEPTVTNIPKTYILWVMIIDNETLQAVDSYPAEIANMADLGQAQLAARLMAGIL